MEKKGATAQRTMKETITAEQLQVYNVTVTNQSNQAWNFLVYQEPPTNAQSLAWLASFKKIGVDSYITFEWRQNYQFVWAKTGELRPGIHFGAGPYQDCDPSNNNVTTFSVENNTPHLTPSKPGGDEGYLTIHDGQDVPTKRFSVGLAISGIGIFAENAGPGWLHVFKPTTNYWVGAMDKVKEGEVIDIKTITHKAKLLFPSNVYHLSATLNDQNEWEIK